MDQQISAEGVEMISYALTIHRMMFDIQHHYGMQWACSDEGTPDSYSGTVVANDKGVF